MKFETREISKNGVQYVFITKGRQKVTDSDIDEYFKAKDCRGPFLIPDGLKKIFLSDLRLGLEFCSGKYGASKDEILIEAKRIAPEINLNSIIGK